MSDKDLIKTLAKKFFIKKINADSAEGKVAIEKYKIEGYPTTLIIDEFGDLKKTIKGFRNIKDFKEELNFQHAKINNNVLNNAIQCGENFVASNKSLVSCSPGEYESSPGVCSTCPAGSYCVGGNPAPAPVLCSVGTFCPTGSSSATACPAGYYCPVAGTITPTTCPGGSYCPNNSTVPTLCPIGTYCPIGAGASIPCPGGTYCPTIGGTTTTPCPSGNYCPINSSSPTACPAGFYCPVNSSSPTACPAGNYCPINSSSPSVCPAGFYCPINSSLPTACPAGFYCPISSSVSTLCPAGFYCPLNSSIGTTCPAGYYCPSGSSAPIICPPGANCPIGSAMYTYPSVGIGTTSPDASAMLDIVSDASGLLIPRMDSMHRVSILSPANALLVYQTDKDKGLYINNVNTWQKIPLIFKATHQQTIPILSAGSVFIITVLMNGAELGSVVNVSPKTNLTSDLVIAYANVIAANTVNVVIKNTNNTASVAQTVNFDIVVTK